MPQPNLEERLRGYKDVFEDHPDIKIVEVFNMTPAMPSIEPRIAWRRAHQGWTRSSAWKRLLEGTWPRLKRQNATDRLVVAMDVDEQTLNLIKQELLTQPFSPWLTTA